MLRSIPISATACRSALVAFAFWSIFGLLFASQTFWEVRTHGHSPFRIFAYDLGVWYFWALLTPLIVWAGRRAPLVPFSWPSAAIHCVLAVSISVMHIIWWTTLCLWIRPFDWMGIQNFRQGVASFFPTCFLLELLIYVAVLGAIYSFDYHRRFKERDLLAAQLETSLATSRLHALELQIRPHFLFNTLHAIGGLVRQKRTEEAVEMISGLSDLLRYSLEQSEKQVPLEREMSIVARYLDLQKHRFSDRLTVSICVKPEAVGAMVPAMILQPLAENAIRHGIEPSASAGTIEIQARRDGDDLVIEIFNTGPAVSNFRDGIGIGNTTGRLQQLYGVRQSFQLINSRGGVVASLRLPFQERAS